MRKANPIPKSSRSKRRPSLDARVAHSLWLLTDGDVTPFLDYTRPPNDLRRTIRQADAPLVRGLLIEILQRIWEDGSEFVPQQPDERVSRKVPAPLFEATRDRRRQPRTYSHNGSWHIAHQC